MGMCVVKKRLLIPVRLFPALPGSEMACEEQRISRLFIPFPSILVRLFLTGEHAVSYVGGPTCRKESQEAPTNVSGLVARAVAASRTPRCIVVVYDAWRRRSV